MGKQVHRIVTHTALKDWTTKYATVTNDKTPAKKNTQDPALRQLEHCLAGRMVECGGSKVLPLVTQSPPTQVALLHNIQEQANTVKPMAGQMLNGARLCQTAVAIPVQDA